MEDPPTSAAELAGSLNEILTTVDNEQRRRLENRVVKTLRNSGAANIFIQVILDRQNTTPGVRQLASVLLEKKVLSLFRSLQSLEDQAAFKDLLISALASEQHKLVRFAVARVVCKLGKTQLEDNQWPGLITAIQQAAQSMDPAHREIAMILCFSLADAASEDLLCLFGQVVASGLIDVQEEVRQAAFDAVSSLLTNVHGNPVEAVRALLDSLLPKVFQSIEGQVLNQSRVSAILKMMDVLEQITELHVKEFGKYIDELFNFMLRTSTNRNAHMRVREQCGHVLGSLVTNKPKMIVRKKLLPIILQHCMSLLAEDETVTTEKELNEQDDELDDDELDLVDVRPPTMWTGQLLVTVADAIPSKHIVPPLLQYVTQGQHSENPLERKSIVLSLAAVAPGCSTYLRRQISGILDLTCKLMINDPVPFVREAAAFALTMFCESLQPEILQYHHILFPALNSQLVDPHDSVRMKVARTLDALCENVAEDLDPYLPTLLPRMVESLTVSSVFTQKSICSALASIAQTKRPAVSEFAPQLLNVLQAPFQGTQMQHLSLRAQVTETVGVLAVAMGKEAFSPYLNFFTGKVMEGLRASSHPELREHSFGFMGHICELLGKEFAPFVAELLPILLDAVEEDTGKITDKHPLAKAQLQIGSDDDSDSNSSDLSDQEGEPTQLHMRVRTADVEEKSSAIHTIGVFAEQLTNQFEQYADKCLDILETFSDHFHHEVRENSILTMEKIILSLHEDPNFEKAVGVFPTEDTLPQRMRDALDRFIQTTILPTIDLEAEKGVVSACCDCIVDIVNKLGSVGVHTFIDEIVKRVILLLLQETPCQTTGDDSSNENDDPENNDVQDHDMVLIDSVSEIVDTLAVAYGRSFAPYFNQIAPSLFPYCEENRDPRDHMMAVGVIANTIDALCEAATPFFDRCFEIAVRVISTSDELGARANSAFLMKSLVERIPHRVDPEKMSQMLTVLYNTITTDPDTVASDNAITAVCTICRCFYAVAPLNHILPHVLAYLPMKVDKQENKNAIESLSFLLTTVPHIFSSEASMMQALANCAARFFNSAAISIELKNTLASALCIFSRDPQCGMMLQEAVSHLSGKYREAMQNYVF